MTRLRLVSAPDSAEAQKALNLAEHSGYQVTFDDGVYRLEAGPFPSTDGLIAYLSRPGFCLECGREAEQLCGVCVTSHVEPTGAADGTGKQVEEEEGRSRHPSAAPRRHLEVVT